MNLGPMSAYLSRNAGLDPAEVDFVALDVETTGLDAATHRVIEVAAVRIRDGDVIDEFATLVNPQRKIQNTQYHGIANRDVRDAPTWQQVAPVLSSYLSGAVMVCHNSVFDHAFLTHEFGRVGFDISGVPTLCTLVTARAQLDLWGYKLSSTAGRVTGIWPSYDHTALDDARTTARLLRGFLKDAPESLRLDTPSPVTLPGLPAASVTTRHRVQGDRGDLVHIVEQLPATAAAFTADRGAVERYRSTLEQAMVDHRISLEEAQDLASVICCGGLTRDAVEVVHRDLLEEHRLAAHADGVVTWEEGEALRRISALVGMPEHIAAEERLGRLDKVVRRALADWRVVGIGLDDDVAEVLDIAADHAAATGTSITARTRLVVVNDQDRSLPRVRRAEENGTLMLNPQAARAHLLAAIENASASLKPADPERRRVPVVRWQEHWRPVELKVGDCVGRFDYEARVNAVARASRRSTQPVPVMRRTVEQGFAPTAPSAGVVHQQGSIADAEGLRTPRMPIPAAEVRRPQVQPAAEVRRPQIRPAAEPAPIFGAKDRDGITSSKGAPQHRPLLKMLYGILAVVAVATLLSAGGPGFAILLIIGVIAFVRRLLRRAG